MSNQNVNSSFKPKAKNKPSQKYKTNNKRPISNKTQSKSRPRPDIGDRKIVLFNKPFDVLCQFTDDQNRKTLQEFIPIKDIYAAGRLDRDSEGLLLLTNDGVLQNQLTNPKQKTDKTYWVQVEGNPTAQDLAKLRQGVELKDGMTLPAKIEKMYEPTVWDRVPPIRDRASIPTTWLSITINEGRNRQVRRMTAFIGFPTLRLIRYSIGQYTLDNIENGHYKVVD